MQGLISRQAALKELAVYIHLIDKTMGKGTLTDDDCMEAAKSVLGEDELPAVQPEIIRCKDCKFSHMTNDGRYCKYCDQFTDTDDYGELVEMYFDSNFYCGYAERRIDG